MLSLSEIEKFYPPGQQRFSRNIIREYLQTVILEIIFGETVSDKLSFIGGTCLRFRYGTGRFSEDLDFDNFGLTAEEFDSLAVIIAARLKAEGYSVEIKTVNKGAFRCYIRIPEILHFNKLSAYKEEKILIQLDSEAQGYNYLRSPFLLNRFDIVTMLYHSPPEILLSQKLWAILNRKQVKGRDFYDVFFLYSITGPDYGYLEMKAGITSLAELKDRVLTRIENENLSVVSNDVRPFLLNAPDAERIIMFREFIEGLTG